MLLTLRLTLTFWLIIRDAYLKHCKQKNNNKIWPTSSPCLFKRCFKLIMTFNQRYMKETLSRDRFMKINSYHRKPIPSLLIFISIHFCRHQIVWAILITDHMETKNNIFAFIKEIRIIRILRFTPSGFFLTLCKPSDFILLNHGLWHRPSDFGLTWFDFITLLSFGILHIQFWSDNLI